MKTAIISIITSLLAALVVFFIMNTRQLQYRTVASLTLLNSVERTVRKSLMQSETDIQRQLSALSDIIAANNEFSLKILVENDRSSSIITGMAGQFLKPMNFSVLEITDSTYSILSSGHFPANAGNSCKKKAEKLSETPLACIDNVMGTNILTLQAKKKFVIADFSFYVLGGSTIDTTFLKKITPAENITLLLKNGSEYTGMSDIRSISEIKDHELIINDKKYFASTIEIPSVGIQDSLTLFVLIEQ